MGRRLLPALLLVVCPAGCGGDGAPASPSDDCSASATYGVTFTATWDATSHGSSPPFPSNAHFSRLVGSTHLEQVSFWSGGATATQGIENMAETGSVTVLCDEVQAEADQGRAGDCIRGQEASFSSPGTATLAFGVDERFPFLTLVSMIAPSPDWFVGVDGIALQQGGCWLPRIEMELTGHDAGTDSGATFTAVDADVTPHEPIGPIEALPDDVREVPFATLVVTREGG